MEVFGNTGTLYWVADYQDLASLERMLTQLGEDEQLQTIFPRAAGLLVGGTVRDQVLRSL